VEDTVDEIKIKQLKTAYGELILGSSEGKICLCDWVYRTMRKQIDKRIQEGLNADYREGDSPLLKELEKQLDEYFLKKRTGFDLPLLTIGTDFQKAVWTALLGVKYGQTRTYSDLAEMIGKPEAVRAVGSANGANAISIIIPCHRIIGKDGSLGGYAGGVNTKRKLLELEGQPLPDWED